MSPQAALLTCLGFIGWLFHRDMEWRKADSWSLLLPGIWLAIEGSRPVSYWFDTGADESNLEGNPINTLIFGALIFGALVVLVRRQPDLGLLVRRNWALFLLYLFFASSVCWSEVPLITLKRLIKDFGSVLMGLIILSERNPEAAARTVFVRVAYVLLPLSIIFGKYFPEIGRAYTKEGIPMFTGLTKQKNGLGVMVLVFVLFALWDLLELQKNEPTPGLRQQKLIRLGISAMGLWLLVQCDSQTSFVCLVIGALIMCGTGFLLRIRHGKHFLVSGFVAAICLIGLDSTIGLSDMLIRALGRNPTLTGRTEIWDLVRQQNTNPLLGEGFYTFWDSQKGRAVVNAFMDIKSTHNGYLEMYVDGGIAGEALLLVLLLAAGYRVVNRFFERRPFGRISLAFWLLAIIYNFSESSYFRLDVLWFAFLLLTTESSFPYDSVATMPDAEERSITLEQAEEVSIRMVLA